MTDKFPISLHGLRSNQHFLVWEAQRRGLTVEIIHERFEVLRISDTDKGELFLDVDSRLMPLTLSVIAGNKAISKRMLLERRLPAIEGAEFFKGESEKVCNFALQLGFPVVIKPTNATNGSGVHLQVADCGEAAAVFAELEKNPQYASFLVERQVPGNDLRIFITHEGKRAALTRRPPTVVGDGYKPILQLLNEENIRRRSETGIRRFAPITVDAETEKHLAGLGLAFSSVLAPLEEVEVRGNSNVGTGGISIDCTLETDERYYELARRVLDVFPGLPYAGVDLIAGDHRSFEAETTFVCEINTLPSLGIHMAPARGTGRNVAAMIMDLLFPNSAIPSSYDIIIDM